MLRIQTLVDKLGKEYEPMINQIKIAEFTKTIAQLSNMQVDRVPDQVIEEYLTHWAINKFRFFKMLGNKTRVDIPFIYEDETKDTWQEMRELIPDYPAYAPWIYEMSNFKTNKIDASKWDWRDKIMEYLEEIIKDGPVRRVLSDMSITTFFKRQLKAPDDLVTKIGRIYENEEINATFTISIDPVDMMMASENPYKWTSCYRLELMSDSHADGCLAAVLDSSSLITYVWNNKGKYNLYGNFDMKEIRYYRMREWICISDNFATIHFNAIYPGKSNYSQDLEKKYRNVVETFVAKAMFPDVENIWAKTDDAYCERENPYGYGEFSESYMWTLKGQKSQSIRAYDRDITCPCGCGCTVPGTDDGDDGLEYNGDGYTYENMVERYWCDRIDDYCDDQDCEYCSAWRRDNAVCELDENEYCEDTYEAEAEGCFDADESRIVHCGDHCEGCPFYKLHHPEEEEEETEEKEEKIEMSSSPFYINDNDITTTSQSNFVIEGFDNVMQEISGLSTWNNSNLYLTMNLNTYENFKNHFEQPQYTSFNANPSSIYGIPIQLEALPDNIVGVMETYSPPGTVYTVAARKMTMKI